MSESKMVEQNRNITNMSIGAATRLFGGMVKVMKPHECPTFTLIGPSGCGKTEGFEQVAQDCNLSLITRQMSQTHPLEMGAAGLDTASRKMYFAEPVLYEAVMSKPAPRLLFLDEIDRVAPMGQNALMQILLSREQCGYKFDDTYVACAGNVWHAQYTFEFDKALASRLAMVHVEPNTDEWLLWAASHNLDPRVIMTINQCPDVLNQHGELGDGAIKVADPRAWARLSMALKSKALQPKQAGVLVGEHAAQKFMLFANVERDYHKEIKQVLKGELVTLKCKPEERDKLLFVIYLAAAGQVREVPQARKYLENGCEQIGDERTYIAARLISFNITMAQLSTDPKICEIHKRIQAVVEA